MKLQRDDIIEVTKTVNDVVSVIMEIRARIESEGYTLVDHESYIEAKRKNDGRIEI